MMRYIIILIFLTGCVEYFDPTIDPPEDSPIIIDGLLTNEVKNHEVNISRAKYIEESGQNEAVENADVYIEDNEGTRFQFNHTSNGLYTSIDAFAGNSNLQYRLVIIIDSQEYFSEFESMPDPAIMTNMETRFGYETIQKDPGVFSDEPRMNFSVDIEVPDDEVESYFRFDWEATYSVQMPDQGDAICWEERNILPPEELVVETCYATETSSGFLQIFSTEGAIKSETIRGVDVYSVHPTKRFQERYSPEISMYSISRNAYEFWNQILVQNESVGGLFDPPFGPIDGNIYSDDESNDRVIGIFEVASVTKIRSFFSREDAKVELRNYEIDCELPMTDTAGNPRIFPRPFFCCDCRLLPNCTNVKPDFW